MNNKTLMMISSAVAVLGHVSLAMAGINPVVWDNGPAAGGMAYLSQLSGGATVFNAQTADDFMFGGLGMTITDVHWKGAYLNSPPPGPANPGPAFNIRIYADNGSGTAPTGGPGDPSATALATYNTGVGGGNQVGAGPFLDYSYVLSTPFVALPGVKYWLSIQAILDFPPSWGWAVSTLDQLSEAQRGSNGPALTISYWSDPSTLAVEDVAFTLTGTPIPAPGALALLGVAGLIGRARRRR